MSVVAHIVLLAWFPVVLALSSYLRGQKLVVFVLVFGWLALPNTGYDLPGLPDYTKKSATAVAILVAAVVFGGQQQQRFRFRWFDTFPALVCFAPLCSSLANGLGLYDGLSSMVSTTVAFGLPYLIGRTQLSDQQGLRLLCIGIVVGSLVYVPLCLIEMRLSPQLHHWIYGFEHRWNGAGYRLGGWRPIVFLDGGLQLALWMATAALVATWMWWKRVWRGWGGMSAGMIATLLVGMALLCRSAGATLLLLLALAVLLCTTTSRSRWALVAMMLIAPAYMAVRTGGDWAWQPAVDAAALISDDRAGSLRFRFENEDLLVAKALQRPVFGWGGWGRNRVYDETGRDISVTDGLWVIRLGQNGLLGLVSYFAVLLLPLWLLLRRYPVRVLLSRELAPALALAVIIVMYAIDCLPNSMPNPIYLVASGGILGFVTSKARLTEPCLATARRSSRNNVLTRDLRTRQELI